MKKRLLPLSLLMVLGLVACGTTPSSSETPSSEQPSSEVPSSSEEQPSSEEPSSSEVESLFMDVYFEAPETWATSINIYLWNGAGNLAAWPGSPMENVEDNLYKFNYDVNLYPNVIFNDGTNQTADLTSPTDPNVARYADGEWVSTIPSEPEVTMSITNKDALTAEWHLGDEPRTIDFAFEPEINVNGAILSGDLVITSSNTEAVAINGRAIQAVAEGEATITATYLNELTDSFNVTVLEEVGMPITALADVWAGVDAGTLAVGDEVRIQGIIASTMLQEDGHIHSGVYLQNGDIPMPLYAGSLGEAWLTLGLEVGDAIDVVGKLDIYNGLVQVKPNAAEGSVKVLENHEIATPTVLQLTGDNYNAEALKHEMGRLVEAQEAVYVSGTISDATQHASISFKLPKEDGTFENATLRYNYHVGTEAGDALKATIDGLNPGDVVNLKGSLLWYNGPQITPTFSAAQSAGECIEFVRAGELPAPTSVTVKGEATVEVGTTTQLTVEVNEGADPSVEWTSSDEAIATVDTNGLVTGVATGKATITATSKKDESVKGTLEIEVLTSSEPPLFAANTIAEIIDYPAAEMTQAFAISGVTVKSWNGTATDGGQYGNFNITDGTTDILVYGATADADALAWNGEKYVYTNPKNFATNALTSSIAIDSELELIVVVTSYKGTKQLNAIVTKVGETGEGNPAAQPLPLFVETIADATGHAAAEMTQMFVISGVTVKSWRNDGTDGTKYGNFNITDGTTDILVYGATATESALTWTAEDGYKFNNPQDFLTNELTSTIVIGSELTLAVVVTSYKDTKQLNAIVLDVVNAGDTPVEPEDPSEAVMFDWATCTQDSYSTEEAVYSSNGVKVTNAKASSTTNIRDCKTSGDRALRLYKSSDVTIEFEKEFTSLVITFDTGYDSETQYCLPAGTYGDATATLEGVVGTLTFAATTSLTLTGLPNQIRIISIQVVVA